MNTKVEAQGGELVLRNAHGDVVIIPRNKRREALGYLAKGDHSAIDAIAMELPKASDYAMGGAVYDGGEDPIEGVMGPETTIVGKRPFSVKNFLNRWGKHHAENPSDNFFGALGQGLMAPLQLAQAGATYALTGGKEIEPGAALRGSKFTNFMNKLSNSPTMDPISKAAASALGSETGQNILFDPLNIPITKGVQAFSKTKPLGITENIGSDLIRNGDVEDATKILNKIDNNSFYRQIGKEGYEDAIKTGVIRSNPIGEYAGKAPYFVEGKDFDKLYSTGAGAVGKKPEYIFEMPQLKNPEEMSAFRVNQQAEYSPYVAGSKEIPISQGKIYRLNNNNEYELIDATKAGSKLLNKTDDVGKQAPKQWQLEELPGLHLKSTMEGEAISKIVEPKTGLVNVEQALAIIGKESGGANKVALIKQGLGNNIPKKMDYNEFRKTVQDQLIPLEKQFATHSSNYGLGSLGYPSPKHSSFQFAIQNGENHILQLENQIKNIKSLKESPDGGKLLNSLTDELNQAKINLDFNKSMLSKLPLENQTLILGNKSKFGRGSSAHGNPDETLGHIHFLRDAETPDVLTVTQIQSDAFQGTHRIMPKDSKNLTALEKQQKSLARMEELQERNKSILHKMKTEGLDEAGLPVQDYQIKQFEDIVKAQEQSNLFKKADIENFTQKQLLDKNHQERYLQELVDYAGKRGDVNKIRVPTSETAAKVQGYDAKKTWNTGSLNNGDNVILSDGTKGTVVDDTFNNFITIKTENGKELNIDFSDAGYGMSKQSPIKSVNNVDVKEISEYTSEHQTILKKYSEQPKTIKKLFGVEPKIVTDSKGNTWYEFDIPKKFKQGKGEIKAFQFIPPVIGGAALYLQSQQNKNN